MLPIIVHLTKHKNQNKFNYLSYLWQRMQLIFKYDISCFTLTASLSQRGQADATFDPPIQNVKQLFTRSVVKSMLR